MFVFSLKDIFQLFLRSYFGGSSYCGKWKPTVFTFRNPTFHLFEINGEHLLEIYVNIHWMFFLHEYFTIHLMGYFCAFQLEKFNYFAPPFYKYFFMLYSKIPVNFKLNYKKVLRSDIGVGEYKNRVTKYIEAVGIFIFYGIPHPFHVHSSLHLIFFSFS